MQLCRRDKAARQIQHLLLVVSELFTHGSQTVVRARRRKLQQLQRQYVDAAVRFTSLVDRPPRRSRLLITGYETKDSGEVAADTRNSRTLRARQIDSAEDRKLCPEQRLHRYRRGGRALARNIQRVSASQAWTIPESGC